MKTLLELLGQDLLDQVTAKLGDVQIFLHEKDQKVIIDDGKLVPIYRIEELSSQKRALTEQLEKAEKDLKDLKKLSTGNEELTNKITALQDENKHVKDEAAKSELKMKKALAVKESLMNAGVSDPDARDLLLSKFDVETLELDEAGKVKDFDAKLKPIKENKVLGRLFGEIKNVGDEHQTGIQLGEWATKNPFSKKTLNITEQIRLLREDKELAEKLKLAAIN